MIALVENIIEQLGDTRRLEKDVYELEAHSEEGVLHAVLHVLQDRYGKDYIEVADISYFDEETGLFMDIASDRACELMEKLLDEDYKNR